MKKKMTRLGERIFVAELMRRCVRQLHDDGLVDTMPWWRHRVSTCLDAHAEAWRYGVQEGRNR